MAISYFEKGCPFCGDIKVFQRFEGFSGAYITCMECGYRIFEWEEEDQEDLGPLINFDINDLED